MSSYFNETKNYNSFTKVSQFLDLTEQVTQAPKNEAIKTEKVSLNQTSRFEYTTQHIESTKPTQTINNEHETILDPNLVNLSHLMTNLELTKLNDEDEDIVSSPIVVHACTNEIPTYEPNSVMFMLLQKIDQIFSNFINFFV